MSVKQALYHKVNAFALFTISLVGLDILTVVLAFYSAYRLRLLTPYENIPRFTAYLPILVIQVVMMLVVFYFLRLYHMQRARSSLDEISKVFAGVVVGKLIALAFSSLLLLDAPSFPRLMFLYDGILAFLSVSAGRFLHGRLVWTARARGFGIDWVLIIGATEVGRMIHQKIAHSPGLGYRVGGYVTEVENGRRSVLGVPVLGSIGDIPSIIVEQDISEVIVALPEATRGEILEIVSLCEQGKVSIKVFPDVFQIMASEVSIGVLDGLPLLTIRDPALRGWKLSAKRSMDIVVSAMGLIVLSPFMLFTAFLIKLDSPGPAFYFQERAGLDARPFQMIKFRSMRQDAERSGPGWTIADDPRRTKLGTLIRRLSIDEFPQLINVLLGDMSLVGPRPERPVYVEQFRRSIPRYMDRHREKAGITGWAQVNGLRGDTSIAERTKYDLWYVENWSLLLDLKIILRTLLKVFSDEKAY